MGKHNLLPEFQDYLISKKLVARDKTSYFAYWVSKFLPVYKTNQKLALESRIHLFLKNLEDEGKAAPWQIEQAENSIKLFLYSFLNGNFLAIEELVSCIISLTQKTGNIKI